MPIPEGYTRKATNDYGVKPAASTASTVAPAAISSQIPRKTGDEAGPDPVTTTNSGEGFNIGSPEDYSNATIDELQDHLKRSKNLAMAGRVATVALGPVGMLIGVAAKANQAIVERRIENELRNRAVKAKTGDIQEILGMDGKALKLEGANSKEGLSKLLGQLKISRALETDEKMISKRGDNIRDTKRGLFSTIADAIFDPMARRRDESVAASRIQDDADNSASSYSSTGVAPTLRPKLRPQPTATQKVAEQAAATERLYTKEAKEQRAAEREADRVSTRDARVSSGDLKKNEGGGYSYAGDDIEGYRASVEKEQADRRTESVKDFFGGFFGNEGGLVAKPVAKQKKKQTTQRRKGLGTRP